MKSKNGMQIRFGIRVLWVVIGGLFGYFIFHPIVMITGHIMLEQDMSHEHGILEIIVSETVNSFSLGMLPWSIAFTIAGALIANFYGKLRQSENRLRQFSYIDGLTGIANYRYFQENFDREWKHGIRIAEQISLIMCDIDFFKAYNDAYGHQKGDKCLQLIAGSLSETLKRPRDIIARYGGEEFIVILPDTNLNGASSVAEAMRVKVESLKIAHHKSKVSEFVTISLGVATIIPSKDSQDSELISAADKALYQAKEEGRNRVKLSG